MSTTADNTSNEAPPAHLVNFACGHPDYALLPVQEIAQATQQALLPSGDGDDNGRKWLQYGRENGNYPAREAVASFLTTLYQLSSSIDPDALFMTSGVSHGIQLTCRTLLRMHNSNSKEADKERPLCWVEDPTYFLVPPIVSQSGYDLQTVPTSPESGLDVASLERQVKAVRQASSDRLLVVYCIPIHHNPLGVSLSDETRRKLLEICETYRVYLIADEVYHGLTFPTSSQTASTSMACMTTSPYVISVAAFTKILCPGIRCGWIHTSHRELLRHIGQDGVLDSGGCSSQLSSGIVRQLILSGKLYEYMTSTQAEFAKRCQHLCTLLQEASDDKSYSFQFRFAIPQGGYFLWVQVVQDDEMSLPFAMDDEAFRLLCLSEYHVDFKAGSSCSSAQQQKDKTEKSPFANSIRLCFAYYDIPALTKGVERLCQAIQAYSLKCQQQSSAL